MISNENSSQKTTFYKKSKNFTWTRRLCIIYIEGYVLCTKFGSYLSSTLMVYIAELHVVTCALWVIGKRSTLPKLWEREYKRFGNSYKKTNQINYHNWGKRI